MHVPHAARDDLIEKYRKLPEENTAKTMTTYQSMRYQKGRRSVRGDYAAMVEQVDEGLGAIVQVLQQKTT